MQGLSRLLSTGLRTSRAAAAGLAVVCTIGASRGTAANASPEPVSFSFLEFSVFEAGVPADPGHRIDAVAPVSRSDHSRPDPAGLARNPWRTTSADRTVRNPPWWNRRSGSFKDGLIDAFSVTVSTSASVNGHMNAKLDLGLDFCNVTKNIRIRPFGLEPTAWTAVGELTLLFGGFVGYQYLLGPLGYHSDPLHRWKTEGMLPRRIGRVAEDDNLGSTIANEVGHRIIIGHIAGQYFKIRGYPVWATAVLGQVPWMIHEFLVETPNNVFQVEDYVVGALGCLTAAIPGFGMRFFWDPFIFSPFKAGALAADYYYRPPGGTMDFYLGLSQCIDGAPGGIYSMQDKYPIEPDQDYEKNFPVLFRNVGLGVVRCAWGIRAGVVLHPNHSITWGRVHELRLTNAITDVGIRVGVDLTKAARAASRRKQDIAIHH